MNGRSAELLLFPRYVLDLLPHVILLRKLRVPSSVAVSLSFGISMLPWLPMGRERVRNLVDEYKRILSSMIDGGQPGATVHCVKSGEVSSF